MEQIGVIAGRGNFPILFAQETKAKGHKVIAIGVKGNTPLRLKKFVDKIHWIKVTEFKNIAQIFKQANVTRVALAGQINPYLLFNRKVISNPQISDFLGNIEYLQADSIFRAFVDRLQKEGLEILDSTLFLSKYIVRKSVLTKRAPSEEEQKDIVFGFKVAKHLGAMDIGQSVCVKNRLILSVESIEGTDRTIRRATSLSKSPIVLVKVSKPSQDMRFDVPVVGLKTIRNLPKNSCLALEANKTLFFEREEAIRLADKKGIAISAEIS